MLLRQVAGTASFRPLGIVATRSSTPLRLSECSPQPARLTPLRGRRKRAAPIQFTNPVINLVVDLLYGFVDPRVRYR